MDKQKLFRSSEILKDTAIQLFDGEESMVCVYGLLRAASEILKECKKKDYVDAVIEATAILWHLEKCTGCVSEGGDNE
jgi:hypothetical protein